MPTPEAPAAPQLRLVLAVSLDGRLAPPQGGAAQIGGRGDRRALEEALAWADAALIGAETLRLHGSTCLIHAGDLLQQRAASGRSAQPHALVVSRSGRIPADLPFFAQPLQRWLLIAAAAGPGVAARPPLPGFAQVVPLLGWRATLSRLAAAGLQRLLVLGGAALATSLLAEDCLDELQLTLCPRLLGGPHSWLQAAGPLPAAGEGWRLLEQRSLPGEELLLRYGRGARAVADPGLVG